MFTLQYVQIENTVVLVDSRVYCRDIIEVHHGDWFNDTLKKYQPLIESRFGIVRFETGLTGKRGMPEKYALLTEPQCNLLLALSRNIGKVAEKKADLIADFEEAKNQIRLQLERSLSPIINPQLDATRFDYCFDAAIQVCGYRNKYDTMQRLLAYLNEGADYRWDGATLWLCNPIYYSFIAASRTIKGIDVEKIGQTVTLDWGYYCRVNKALRTPKNALFPKSCFVSNNGQLSMNLGV